MNTTRSIKRIITGIPTREGAGVLLTRLFGYHEVPEFDPFLLFDDFSSDNPEHYLKGFPWHPHRGIETITYVLAGEVDHGDSMGNSGTIGKGDLQWMTAGNGIIHQEMPRGDEQGRMYGFQLWANLPAAQKMMNHRYRDVTSEQIPVIKLDSGIRISIIAGKLKGTAGPVQDIVTDPEYLDITIPAETFFTHPVPENHTVFAYIIKGAALFDARLLPKEDAENRRNEAYAEQKEESLIPVTRKNIVLFNTGENVQITSGDIELRFLLISGKPIGEPVAWHGPIVMNSEKELNTAIYEFQEGTFIKYRGERK
jgi:redox-sensitive bicupin YhaK (pirin superfamily)